jgi:hypothetical protein
MSEGNIINWCFVKTLQGYSTEIWQRSISKGNMVIWCFVKTLQVDSTEIWQRSMSKETTVNCSGNPRQSL